MQNSQSGFLIIQGMTAESKPRVVEKKEPSQSEMSLAVINKAGTVFVKTQV